MCSNPFQVKPGLTVACGRCAWCRSNRVKDFVGRCLAELATSSAAYALTLTYSGDVVNATSLYYVDVQRMLYRLRTDGYSVRYICAGEHGEKKGRAHWHIILFFTGQLPHIPLESRYNWKYWPHGFTYAQQADYGGFSYLMKYTLKDDKQRGFIKVLRVSKKPPLGYLYFQDLAARMVDARLAVFAPEYSFSDVLQLDAKENRYRPRKFWLSDRSQELFLEGYCRQWQERYGDNPPDTEYLWETLYDPIAKREKDLSAVSMEEQVELRRMAALEFALRPRPKSAFAVQNGFLFLPAGNLVVSYSDGSAVLIWEDEKWRLSDSGNGAVSVSVQLNRIGLDPALSATVCEWLCPESVASGSLPPSTTRAYPLVRGFPRGVSSSG